MPITHGIGAFPNSFLDGVWETGWQELYERFHWLRAMDGVRQDSVFHGEGDVLTHTKMVCEMLMQLPEWQQMDELTKNILFTAALLHDVAKPFCTKTEDNKITSRGHALKGEILARKLLYKEGGAEKPVPVAIREKIVKLVRFHGLPVAFLEKENPVRAVLEASQMVRLDWLAVLAKADAMGRYCPDQQDLLAKINLFIEFCQEQDCYRERRQFADDYSRFIYFQKENGDPAYQAYDATKVEVILLAGLPAAGKDTWIANNCSHLPVISLDKLREELKVSPVGEQGYVVQTAKERARQFLRARQPFVWNATNLTKKLRRQLIGLFSDYGASVKLVYLEAPYEEILKRNQARSRCVPKNVIDRMIDKLEVPDLTEAYKVQWSISR